MPMITRPGTVTVFVCYLIKDGAEMAIYQVFAGGLMLGAFFMATDYATSPVTVPGMACLAFTLE